MLTLKLLLSLRAVGQQKEACAKVALEMVLAVCVVIYAVL